MRAWRSPPLEKHLRSRLRMGKRMRLGVGSWRMICWAGHGLGTWIWAVLGAETSGWLCCVVSYRPILKGEVVAYLCSLFYMPLFPVSRAMSSARYRTRRGCRLYMHAKSLYCMVKFVLKDFLNNLQLPDIQVPIQGRVLPRKFRDRNVKIGF